jgi:hypothetical protein
MAKLNDQEKFAGLTVSSDEPKRSNGARKPVAQGPRFFYLLPRRKSLPVAGGLAAHASGHPDHAGGTRNDDCAELTARQQTHASGYQAP